MGATPYRYLAVAIGAAGCLLGGSAALAAGNVANVANATNAANVGDAGISANWHVVSSPNVMPENALMQVSARSLSDAWAVGFAGSHAFRRTLVEHWNGKAWRAVGSPSPGNLDNELNGVSARTATDAWAVGTKASRSTLSQPLIEHWNGKTWRTVPAKQPGKPDSELYAVSALGPRNVWAVGQADIGRFLYRPLIEHWNGKAWSVASVPSPKLTGTGASLAGISAISPNDIWTVGTNFGTSDMKPIAEHWNGKRWSLVSMPAPTPARISGISMLSSRDGWAVGMRTANGATRAFVEHWNGSRWAPANSPAIRASVLFGVRALSPSQAWAVGFQPGKGGPRTLIEHWNGRTWSVVSSPNRGTNNSLSGIAGTQQRLWAVGSAGKTTLTLRR